jgi:Domain of unknown function (DUF4337)
MPEGTEHHLEHAEHVQHQAHDPFDRRVAMTMAIMAAVLAGVTMFSHRSHNEVLRLLNEALLTQNEARGFDTKADICHTRASDQWSYFQAKKNRLYNYEAYADLVTVLAKPGNAPKPAGEEQEGADDPKVPDDVAKLAKNWKSRAATYSKQADDIEKEARKLKAEAEQLQEQAQHKQAEAEEKTRESEHVHHQADRLDYGHLGLEFALVLCSVAVLTKQRGFWLTGVGVAVIGALVALSAFLMH